MVTASHYSTRDLHRTLWVLTPPAPLLRRAVPNAQSSGAFDLGAMYASVVIKSVQRAYASRQRQLRTSLPRLPPLPVRRPNVPRATLDVLDMDEVEVPIIVEMPPVRGARALAWLGVAVSWLTTTALAVLIGTSLPAHLHSAPATTAAAPTEEAASPPSPAAAAVLASASTDSPPVIAVEDLPVARPRPPSAWRNAEPGAEPKKMRPSPASGAIAAVRASSAPAVVRVKAAKEPPRPLTLEEAMRQAVAADMKRLKH
jgi:hypothetical protein